ncbi:MAG: hypothetical protein NWP97_08430 [Ilumatobacteraceae bacterium]|nr:hypothetical protein [Ilumatobacteraceae bacterium]
MKLLQQRSSQSAVLAALLLFAVACGSSDSDGATTTAANGTVAGIGNLPDQVSTTAVDPSSETSAPIQSRPLTVGELSNGPRLLMIGDSIFAAVSRRYSNMACDRLVPMGWQVAVEAERGRFIDLGLRIVKKKLPQGFDAAVLFLGTNYGKKQDVYQEYLDKILDELAPRPVIILTATEYKPFMQEVNAVIEEEVRTRDNLWLVDWREISKTPGVLSKDGIHPVDAGNVVLMDSIINVLGNAPGGEPGECLKVEFKNDAPLSNLPTVAPGVETTVATETTSTLVDSATTVPTSSTVVSATTTTAPLATSAPTTTSPPSP